MLFNEYLQNLPRLHSWDGGKSWNAGGFNAAQLEKLHGFLLQALPAAPVMLETGAGNSTLTLLYLRPQRLVSIAPDVELESRIRRFCQENSIDDTSLEFHADGSQWVLPELAISNRRGGSILDFALIDGSHGWPTAFVDLEYCNMLLKREGYLLIDDVDLHSCKEIARLLVTLPDYELVCDLGKALVFQKKSDSSYLGEWTQQPYIYKKSKAYSWQPDRYALREPSVVAGLLGRARWFARGVVRRAARKFGRSTAPRTGN